jgi:Arc/MetJ-type ribon-helix-helix transcriptional regulator
MTIHLPPDIESSIQAAVHSGRYASLDDAMAEAASLLVQRLRLEQAQAKPPAASLADPALADKPIWEVIEEENHSIPPEVWNALPTDLSEQHDHYIYGTPKQPAQ